MQQPGVNIAQAIAGLRRTGRRRKRLSVSKRIPKQECIDRLNALDGRKYESAGFIGFDGATEWLKFSPELLEEFRQLGK